jgi:hypothetical protein
MICPYCETEIPGVTPQRRSRRRRSSSEEEPAYEGEAPAYEGFSQPPPGSAELAPATPAALEHVSQPPPSFEDLDRARAEYEDSQATQAFTEISEDEAFGSGSRERAYEDTPWSDPSGPEPGGSPPAR